MFMSENEQIAIVTYDSGLICAYDVKTSFNWIGVIENSSTLAGMHEQKSIVLEKTSGSQLNTTDGYAVI
jgi:hypothetical protein